MHWIWGEEDFQRWDGTLVPAQLEQTFKIDGIPDLWLQDILLLPWHEAEEGIQLDQELWKSVCEGVRNVRLKQKNGYEFHLSLNQIQLILLL